MNKVSILGIRINKHIRKGCMGSKVFIYKHKSGSKYIQIRFEPGGYVYLQDIEKVYIEQDINGLGLDKGEWVYVEMYYEEPLLHQYDVPTPELLKEIEHNYTISDELPKRIRKEDKEWELLEDSLNRDK